MKELLKLTATQKRETENIKIFLRKQKELCGPNYQDIQTLLKRYEIDEVTKFCSTTGLHSSTFYALKNGVCNLEKTSAITIVMTAGFSMVDTLTFFDILGIRFSRCFDLDNLYLYFILYEYDDIGLCNEYLKYFEFNKKLLGAREYEKKPK